MSLYGERTLVPSANGALSLTEACGILNKRYSFTNLSSDFSVPTLRLVKKADAVLSCMGLDAKHVVLSK